MGNRVQGVEVRFGLVRGKSREPLPGNEGHDARDPCHYNNQADGLQKLLKLASHETPTCAICQTDWEALLHNGIGSQ